MLFSLHSAFFSIHRKHDELSLYNLPTAILGAGVLFSFFEGECIIHQKHIHGVRSATDFEWSSWRCCNYDGAWNISNKYRTIFLQQHEFLELYDP